MSPRNPTYSLKSRAEASDRLADLGAMVRAHATDAMDKVGEEIQLISQELRRGVTSVHWIVQRGQVCPVYLAYDGLTGARRLAIRFASLAEARHAARNVRFAFAMRVTTYRVRRAGK